MVLDIIQQLGANYNPETKGWRYQNELILPQRDAKNLVTYLHKLTHLGKKKMATLLS